MEYNVEMPQRGYEWTSPTVSFLNPYNLYPNLTILSAVVGHLSMILSMLEMP